LKANLTIDLVINDAEKDVLFTFSGYILKTVKKTRFVCEDCLYVVEDKTKSHNHNANDTHIKFKDYTGTSLTRVSQQAFENVFLPAEQIFRKFIAQNSYVPNILKKLLTYEIPSLPCSLSCHDIHRHILYCFYRARLHLHAKELRNMKAGTKASKGQELGSRRVMMRKFVERI